MVIANEIHKLLRSSRVRQRYYPPTIRQVLLRASGVYAYVAILSSMTMWHIPRMPHKTGLLMGYFCVPMEFSKASSLFYYLMYVPLLMGIPLLYLQYVAYDVVRNKLLPPKGKRREVGKL